MKKDILIISHFSNDIGEHSDRFNYIAQICSDKHSIEIIISSFSHITKKQRIKQNNNLCKYVITYIDEPGYKRNVSLKRFYSHFVFGRNLKKYLKNRKKPDVVLCAVPSLDAAYVAAMYCKKNGIPFIVDIQDLWPEAFQMVFNIPVLSNLIFYPMKRMADSIYNAADRIIAVSETYANRALNVSRKVKDTTVVFLGTRLSDFDKYACENIIQKPENEFWLTYIGTLGHSYDITTVIDALYIIRSKGIDNIKFMIIGDGPLKAIYERYAKEKDVKAHFMGRLEYGKMVGFLVASDIAVNPITKGAAQSIINKHADYAAAGLPVLNTQECNEYRDLVDEYQMGLNCKNADATDLAEKLIILYKDNILCRQMGKNSRRLAEERFDREVTYNNILRVLEEL